MSDKITVALDKWREEFGQQGDDGAVLKALESNGDADSYNAVIAMSVATGVRFERFQRFHAYRPYREDDDHGCAQALAAMLLSLDKKG